MKEKRGRKKKTDNAIISEIAAFSDQFEYIGGYNGRDSDVTIKCKSCGNVITRRWQYITVDIRKGRRICLNCQKQKPITFNRTLKSDEQIGKLNKKGFDIIGEYLGANEKITVKCRVCGGVFEYSSYHNLMNKNKGRHFCPECYKAEQKERYINDLLQAQRRYIERQRAKEDNAIKYLKHKYDGRIQYLRECRNCGESFYSHISTYCSKKCSDRYQERSKDNKKRKLISSRKHDEGITLDKLYKKESGVCYLCGGICDYNDYVIKDGAFIAGDNYPSIDHV